MPKVNVPIPEILEFFGEEGIRRIVSQHYDLLRKSDIKNLFPESEEAFEAAKLRSSDFFIQILGGHPYFNENRGQPMLRKRHMSFKITPEGRLQWLEAYRTVLEKQEAPEKLIRSYWDYVNVFSMWMVNTQ